MANDRRGNPGLNAPGGWSTSPNYYTPREVKLVPGVSHKSDPYSDTYDGKAEDLVASNIVTADMLRSVGVCSKNWRAEGKGSYGGSMMIMRRRRPGMFTVTVRCSREEATKRQAPAEPKPEARSTTTPDEFRIACLDHARQTLNWALGNGACGELFPFTFPADVRDEIEELLGEVVDLMRSSEVMPLHPEKAAAHGAQAAPPRGHLRLAWSAPEAPAWTADL